MQSFPLAHRFVQYGIVVAALYILNTQVPKLMEAQTSCEATILNMKPHGRKPLA
jgi:hypothetical protein